MIPVTRRENRSGPHRARKITIKKAEMILRIEIDEIRAVPADTMIAGSKPILEGSIPKCLVRPSFA